jgi:hypothetical protein
MRVIFAAAMITMLATTAFAQDHLQQYGEKDKDKSPAEIQADKDTQRAYQRSLNNIPDKGPSDPWGAVRPGDAPKSTSAPTAKPVKTKTKTGAAN